MSKNILTKLILSLLLISTTLFGLEKDSIKEEMQSKMNKVLLVLENKESSLEDKNQEIIKIMDEVFDYSIMSKIALGKNLRQLKSKTQFNEFKEAFEVSLKRSYSDKLGLYNDQKLEILDLIPYKKTRLQLQTKLIGENEVYDINYNFYEDKKTSQWYIYDVELIGVSILQTYRKQFDGVLVNNDISYLITQLKK
jgi:phospholipid transport system substrate-binding protein